MRQIAATGILARADVAGMWRNILPWARDNRFSFMMDLFGSSALARLAAAGFRPDYVEIRRADDLQRPEPDHAALRIFAAAWLGRARLIDNLAVT